MTFIELKNVKKTFNDIDALKKVVQMFNNDDSIDIIDFNMGCPAPKVVKNGDGSKLLLNLELVYQIVSEVVKNSSKPVSLKSAPGRGNVVENIVFENITNNKGIEGVTVTLRYFVQGNEALENMPQIKNVYIKNVDAGLCWHGLRLRGYPEAQLENVILENVKMECIESTSIIENVDGMKLNNVQVKLNKEDWFDWATLGHDVICEE